METVDVDHLYKICRIDYKPEWNRTRTHKAIGRGKFGEVFLVPVQLPDMPKPELCAMKRLNKRNHNLPTDSRNKCIREITALIRLQKYEQFVKFFAWAEDDKYVCIMMEYIELGVLKSYMVEKWSEQDTRVVTRQLLEGLRIMHGDGIIHRDLKPEESRASSSLRLEGILEGLGQVTVFFPRFEFANNQAVPA
jgi:serine/threonine protein kinase